MPNEVRGVKEVVVMDGVGYECTLEMVRSTAADTACAYSLSAGARSKLVSRSPAHHRLSRCAMMTVRFKSSVLVVLHFLFVVDCVY